MVNDTSSCFVIGPIGSSLAPMGSPGRKVYEDALEVLEQVIAPACAAVGLTAVRADAISATGDLTEQIFRHLRDDEVVIADLTGANPNVMYELGLRHTVDKLTIQLGEYDSLPFDIGSIRTIQFSRSPHGLVQARNKLEQALSVGLADKGDLLPATRIWLEGHGSAALLPFEPGLEAEAGPAEDLPGVIEQIADVERLLPELTAITVRISEEVSDLGTRAQSLNPEIEALNQQNAPAAARLNLIARFANSISTPAENLDSLSKDFASRMGEVDDVVGALLSFWSKQPDHGGPTARGFLESLGSLAESTRSGMDGFGSIVPGLRTLSELSRTLRRPVNLILESVARLVESTEVIDGWAKSAQELLNEAAKG